MINLTWASFYCLWPQAWGSALCLPPCSHQQSNVTFLTVVYTCNLLYKVLESAKGLIGFSPFPLLHLPFGNICHFQKEPALWINQIIQLCWHQNNRKVKFPYLEQVRNFSSRSLSKIFDFSFSKSQQNQMLRQIPAMALQAGKQSVLKRYDSWFGRKTWWQTGHLRGLW